MPSLLSPTATGTFVLPEPSPRLLDRLAERIESALIPSASRRRNQYEVVNRSDRSLRFRSVGLWTGIHVGLNDVSIELDRDSRRAHYRISFWTWARYCIGLSAVIAAPVAVLLISAILGSELVPLEWLAPRRQMMAIGLPMVVLWGVVWPWVLILVHRRPAARCLEQILADAADAGVTKGERPPRATTTSLGSRRTDP